MCSIDKLPSTLLGGHRDRAASAVGRAIMLIGHGSVRPGAGASMIRLAERVHQMGVAPIVQVGFLNYSRPTFAEALDRCVRAGALEVIVQPYFLVPGRFVRSELQALVEAGGAAHPELGLCIAEPFGDHQALARLVLKRAIEADYLAANPHITRREIPRALDDGVDWQPLHERERTGLLLMAHGSPEPHANAPIQGVAERIRRYGRYAATSVCFMELNQPSIAEAIDAMAGRGITSIVAVPYFLHIGNHVRDDLPAAIAQAQARHPACTIVLAEHLAYDQLLAQVIADRVAEAVALL